MCHYKNCNSEGTVSGFVLERNEKNPSKQKLIAVKVCESHKKERDFFQKVSRNLKVS